MILTNLVHWIHRVITVFTRGPRFLSTTDLFISVNRPRSDPNAMDWSCRSHSPPWSQIGQSNGWFISKNSITPSRAFFAIGVSVFIFIPKKKIPQSKSQLMVTWIQKESSNIFQTNLTQTKFVIICSLIINKKEKENFAENCTIH